MMSEKCVETSTANWRRIAFLLPSIFTIGIIWSHYHLPGITADGVTYLQIARNILYGKGLGWQALWVPPLHSILIAGYSYITGISDLLEATAMVAPLMFLCLVLAVYYLALEIFDLRTALVASFFTALFPHLLFIAFSPEAEITYAFFLTLSLLLFIRTVMRRSTAYSIATGISFALAWMARSEGFIVMVLVFACVVSVQGRLFYRSTICRHCLLSTLFFMLSAAPYLLFLQKHYGNVVISPKSSYVMIWMKSQVYHDNDKGEMGNDELWGLTPDGEKLRWQEPKGVKYLVDFLMSHPKKSLSVYLHNLGMELPGRIPNNSGMERYPQTYPVYFVLGAVASVFMAWGNFAKEKRTVLLSPFLILFILPIFTGGWWKYLIPYLPLVIVMAAKSFSVGTRIFGEKLFPANAARMGSMLLTVTAAVLGARFIFALHPFSLAQTVPLPIAPSTDVSTRYSLNEEARKAGQFGAQRFGPGKNYMASWGKIVYYLNGLWTALPVADDQELLAYARRNRVDYIVLESKGKQSMAEPGPLPGLELEARYRSSSYPYSADFYRVLPQ
jgi:4-amino-4-deoxy-L-arabinose transferase-like glycosyltransferase